MSKPRPLELQIDRLALRALPPCGERRLREAIAVELTRLLAAEAQHPGRPRSSRLQSKDARGRPRVFPPERGAAVEIAEIIHRQITAMPQRSK
jgi:hypothetical protein